MKMLKSMKNVNALMTAVSVCKGDVIIKSADGNEEYNLRSALSQLIGIAKLCEDHGDEYEVFCMNHEDEGNLLRFFMELHKEDDNTAA